MSPTNARPRSLLFCNLTRMFARPRAHMAVRAPHTSLLITIHPRPDSSQRGCCARQEVCSPSGARAGNFAGAARRHGILVLRAALFRTGGHGVGPSPPQRTPIDADATASQRRRCGMDRAAVLWGTAHPTQDRCRVHREAAARAGPIGPAPQSVDGLSRSPETRSQQRMRGLTAQQPQGCIRQRRNRGPIHERRTHSCRNHVAPSAPRGSACSDASPCCLRHLCRPCRSHRLHRLSCWRSC